MAKQLLLGDEALGQAAIDAGVSTVYGYPGTPSTEIFEYIERTAHAAGQVYAAWAANEKVAYEQALGTSFAGRRALVTMKHVGLNVAADPFMNSASTGAHGGLVTAVADDPGMHSSQNEQDSRFYADFAQVPCFEPATQQEAYDMTREAFDVSERFASPVLVRLVTRLAHSRAAVLPGPPRAPNPLDPSTDPSRWTLVPTNARPQYGKLLDKQPAIEAYAAESRWNELVLNPRDRKLGVIAAGVAYNYFREVAGPEPPSCLKIGLYPLPVAKILALFDHVDEVLILEDGFPYIERRVLGVWGQHRLGRLRGRLSGHVVRAGELTPELVAQALGREVRDVPPVRALHLAARPPQLCQGCPHRDTFNALNTLRALLPSAVVQSDIGCYALGYYKPFETIVSCVDMGASISLAKGAADAGIHPSLCVIGDSTFGHSGMAPLLTAAHENTNMTVVIVDNGTVAMTGTQDSLTTGDRLVEVVAGLGVAREHIRILDPLPKRHDESVALLKEEVDYRGLSVVIARRACVQMRKH